MSMEPVEWFCSCGENFSTDEGYRQHLVNGTHSLNMEHAKGVSREQGGERQKW